MVWARLVGVLVVPLLALSGCAVQAGSGLSGADARAQLYEALDGTQEAVGGSWENQDDPTARGCVIPLWVDGEQFPGLRIGAEPAAARDAVDAVVSAWTDWGYRVETTLVGEVTELQGRNSFDQLLIFRVSETAMTLQGESECRPAA